MYGRRSLYAGRQNPNSPKSTGYDKTKAGTGDRRDDDENK